MTVDNRRTTPTMIQLLELVINSKLADLHVALPGEIVEYDAGTNQASVQPQIKRRFESTMELVSLPILNNVPVVFPRSGDSHLVFPVKSGTTGQILFNERSLDAWQQAGRDVDPDDFRRHDLNDAVFLPGLSPQTDLPRRLGPDDALEIRHGRARFSMMSNNKFKMENDDVELFAQLVDLLSQLADGFNELAANHQTNTILGPQKPINFSAYATIKTSLDEIKAKLEMLGAT